MRTNAHALKNHNSFRAEDATASKQANPVKLVKTVTSEQFVKLLPKEMDCCNRATD